MSGVVIGLVIVLIILALAYKREEYRRIPKFIKPNRCTDGCIYRQRNRGVFVDEQCMNMCRDEWDGSRHLTPQQQNARYYRSLLQSVNSGAFVYDDGLLS